MSRYQDDSQDTAVAGDLTWVGLMAVVDDAVRVTGTLLLSLLVTHADAATASDQVIDRAVHLIVDQAVASDTGTGQLRAQPLMADTIKAGDQSRSVLRVLHGDSAQASDQILQSTQFTLQDVATASDSLITQRRVTTLVSESATASDLCLQFSKTLVIDAAQASDQALGTLRAHHQIVDVVTVADAVEDARRDVAMTAGDEAQAHDVVIDQLHATDLIRDLVIAGDAVVGDVPGGQAWSANVESWAMSRYAPFAFTGLAVIDGVLYGTNAEGVHAIVGGEVLIATLATGDVDLGQGALVHPTAAHLEYSLQGTAAMTVTSTQSGAPQSYSYPLAAEPAAHLTNGRFLFGRGLRGRHFSFVLQLEGTKGHINDLRLEAAPTNRRV